MIMLGCHFMLDVPMPDGSPRPLAEAVPFRNVYIHALIRDANREKMSKTKGNVVDPIEIITKYGTDAVRFTLASMASPGTDIAFSEARTEGYRAFANKIWNAARFLFMNLDRARDAGIEVDFTKLADALSPSENAPLESRWILTRLNQVSGQVDDVPSVSINRALSDYRFDEAANLVYQFFWGDLCDWYLEIVKLRLNFEPSNDLPFPITDDAEESVAETRAALRTLVAVFESALRLLSPFMPFLTEEIWHALYSGLPPAKSIALSQYPQGDHRLIGEQIQKNTLVDMSRLQNFIKQVRNLRKERGVPEKFEVPVKVYADPAVHETLSQNFDTIRRLARVSEMHALGVKPGGIGALSHLGFFEIDSFTKRRSTLPPSASASPRTLPSSTSRSPPTNHASPTRSSPAKPRPTSSKACANKPPNSLPSTTKPKPRARTFHRNKPPGTPALFYNPYDAGHGMNGALTACSTGMSFAISRPHRLPSKQGVSHEGLCLICRPQPPPGYGAQQPTAPADGQAQEYLETQAQANVRIAKLAESIPAILGSHVG